MHYTICLQTAIIESANRRRLIKGHIQNNTKRLLRYVGMYMIKLITHFAVCRMLNGRPIRKQDFEIPNGLIQSLFSVVHSTICILRKLERAFYLKVSKAFPEK